MNGEYFEGHPWCYEVTIIVCSGNLVDSQHSVPKVLEVVPRSCGVISGRVMDLLGRHSQHVVVKNVEGQMIPSSQWLVINLGILSWCLLAWYSAICVLENGNNSMIHHWKEFYGGCHQLNLCYTTPCKCNDSVPPIADCVHWTHESI